MECPQCKKVYETKDFYGKATCYRCCYAQKLLICKDERIKNCKICNQPVGADRTKYCSQECAQSARRKQNKEYWVWNVNTQPQHWKPLYPMRQSA